MSTAKKTTQANSQANKNNATQAAQTAANEQTKATQADDNAKKIAELEKMVKQLLETNKELKTKAESRLTLAEAVKMHEQKKDLESKRDILNDAMIEVQQAGAAIQDKKYHEETTFRMSISEIDFQTGNNKDLLAIGNKFVIESMLQKVFKEIESKIGEIETQIDEIDSKTV